MNSTFTNRLVFSFIAIAILACPVIAEEALTADQVKFFETKIRPVLIKECYGCHSNKAGNVRGGLKLDTRELTHIGGDSGPAVVPGDLEESLLYNAITHTDFVMPPKRKLSPKVIDDFREWIEMGAPDPRINKVAEIRSTISDEDIEQAKENFWAYQAPKKPTPPEVDNVGWSGQLIDRFVLRKIEEAGLSTPVEAPPYKVLRRLCFDLVGLPPTPEQIDYFTKLWQQSPDKAVSLVIDRLLEKPQYGERWGRHWLDVARYGESTGREVNMTYPHAWRYRDYVIDSFNDDKPFDRFVQEQIAGDLLPVKTDQQWSKNLVATTFLAMGSKNVNESNRVQFAADQVDEQIDATTRVFLGTSVACARCHDHKFDAIPQTDYYAMAGIFGNMTTYFGNPPSEYGSFSNVQARRTSSLIVLPVSDPSPYDKRYSPTELAKLKQELEDKLAEQRELRFNQRGGDNAANAQRQRIRIATELANISAKLAVVDDRGEPISYCMGVQENGSPRDARVLVRGEIDQPAQQVPRGFPKVLSSGEKRIPSNQSGRLELARWIGSADNPLTARVMVNRIWKNLMGQGLVTSTENFGITGQAPSHPELLDYLAVRFVESGWSVKSLIKEIASSKIYRISSEFNDRAHDYDPDNALLWRANPRRLDAEALRDAMLMVSGEMDFDRPRGSEVAKAGYVRVRDGVLGDLREKLREVSMTAMRDQMRQRFSDGFRGGNDRQGFQNRQNAGGRPQFGGRFGGRGGRQNLGGRQGFGGQSGQRPQMGSQDDIRAKIYNAVANALDMNDAKFRSVYLPIVRDEVPRSLEVFDFPDASMVSGSRESSNTANQALYMMNNTFVLQQSESFAKRVAKEHSKINDRIRSAFVLAYGRPPTTGEREATSDFFRQASRGATSQAQRSSLFTAFCQSLFAAAEFRYID